MFRKSFIAEPARKEELEDGEVKTLERELHRLSSEVLTLGRTVGNAIAESVDVLRRQSPMGSESLITLDHQISVKRLSIEAECLSLIIAQQPLDGDLRTIASILEIVAELEHIGRYITDIARNTVMVARVDEPLLDLLGDIDLMAVKTQYMLHRAMEAFMGQDVALAGMVHADDDAVDALYQKVYFQGLLFMKGRARSMVKKARYLAQIARNLERAADRVTNICEWVTFCVTGSMDGMGAEPLPVGGGRVSSEGGHSLA
jgi:phosphate transport system protein